MPEATGFVAIKLSEKGRDIFLGDELKSIDIGRLGSEAGIKNLSGNFTIEGKVKATPNYIMFSPFGQEWMPVLEEIANSGSSIELYGVMQDEYGFEQIYILSAAKKRLCTGQNTDTEEDQALNIVRTNAKIEKFLPKVAQTNIPKEIKQSILYYIDKHLNDEKRKKNLPVMLEHEGFQYKLTRSSSGYCSITRENCDGSGEGNIEWAFECASQAKEEFEEKYGLPTKLWSKAKTVS